MKPLFAIMGLVIFLLSPKTYSQRITYKELIGTWDKSDTIEEKSSFKFINASNLTIQNSKNTRFNVMYTLITDSIKDKLIISIEFNTNGIKRFNNYELQSINVNTLRLVNLNSYNGVFQKPSEVNKRIFYLIRRTS